MGHPFEICPPGKGNPFPIRTKTLYVQCGSLSGLSPLTQAIAGGLAALMYTDTVQTFVILAGAFVLMGYGTGSADGGGAQRSQFADLSTWEQGHRASAACGS